MQSPTQPRLEADLTDAREAPKNSKQTKGAADKNIRRVAFSFPVLLAVMLVVAVFVSLYGGVYDISPSPSQSNLPVFEGDTWFHILVGEDILKTRTFPTTDSYSFTAYGNECMAFEWLGQIAMALTAKLAGVRALTALLAALVSVFVLLLYYYAFLRCANAKAAFVACLALLPLLSPFFTLRPQWFGYIFLLICLICLEHFRRGRNWALWIVPPLFVLWVNTHGSFVLGLFVLGFYWVAGLVRFRVGRLTAKPWTARQRLQLEGVFLLCVLAMEATPYGGRLAGFTLHVLFSAKLGMSQINEYLPLGGVPLKLFVLLLLAFLVAQVLFRPRYRLEEFGLLLLLVYGTFVHQRLLFFWIPVFAPFLAVLLARWVPQYDRAKDHYLLNAIIIVIAVLAVAKFFPSRSQLETRVADVFPRGAVEYLRNHPVRGRMFNEDPWGAYLVRSLGPQHKVFIDGRSQLYEDAGVFGDYGRIVRLDRDAQLVLRKYGIVACLISPDTPLATYLAALPDWELAFSDKASSLYVRRQPNVLQSLSPEQD